MFILCVTRVFRCFSDVCQKPHSTKWFSSVIHLPHLRNLTQNAILPFSFICVNVSFLVFLFEPFFQWYPNQAVLTCPSMYHTGVRSYSTDEKAVLTCPSMYHTGVRSYWTDGRAVFTCSSMYHTGVRSYSTDERSVHRSCDTHGKSQTCGRHCQAI
jgi:hypothetical protein